MYLNNVSFSVSSYALHNHSADSFGFAFVDAGCVLKMYYRMENTPARFSPWQARRHKLHGER